MASRDKRELGLLRELGHRVIVMDKGEKNEIIHLEKDYLIHHRKVRNPVAGKYKKTLQRILSIPLWAIYARSLQPDCISCHDLIALFIGWMSTWFMSKKKRPKLVYDAHEFEAGRNTDGKRGKFTKWMIPKAEKFLMKKCAFSIMVNDSIADAVQKAYGLKTRPVVVRNIPPYWEIDEKVCEGQRRSFCDQLGVPDALLVMYHGAIMRGRGLETLLQAIKIDEHICGIIVGFGEDAYINQLKRQVAELGIEKRILFHNAVPVEDLWQYVGAADISIMTIPNVCQSYFYMLPNKLFESIQSLTPIIGSNFPEISKIIKGYDIGICINPDSVSDLVDAIEQLRMDKQLYYRLKKNLKIAKRELCWEREKNVLVNAYRAIF